jgi:hypothetical protein
MDNGTNCESMRNDFQLIDLVSQAGAVQRLLAGKTDSERLAWLSERGRLDILPRRQPEEKQSYRFTSALSREAIFFLDAGRFVFIGDHTTFTVDDL